MNGDEVARDDGPVLLDATLRPSPPMRAGVLLSVLGIVTLINAGFALWFVVHGAWPVMPFMGIDIVLLAWAFRTSTLLARRSEHVTVTPAELRIAAHPVKGPAALTVFNPYWARLDMREPMEHGDRLVVKCHGRALELGRFLAPSERDSFGRTLKAALNAARNFGYTPSTSAME